MIDKEYKVPSPGRVCVVASPYYPDITRLLQEGATQVLKAAQVCYDTVEVVGALELPVAISILLRRNIYQGFIALGCVIRGQTHHFDIVATESARNLSTLAVDYAIPITNGILTVNTHDQALERAHPARKNCGGHAARACVNLLQIKELHNVSC